MTGTRFHTSVTERSSFQTCRRRWYLETIERLTPKGNVTWYFLFGDCVHSALDVYYQPKGKSKKPSRDIGNALDAFKEAWDEKNGELANTFGQNFSDVEEEWFEQLGKGLKMLEYYGTFDRAHPLFDTVIDIGVEERAFVDILTPGEREHLDDFPLLSGRVDIVFQKKDKRIGIMDHKALASMAHDRALDLDDQLTGYAYIWWRLEGTSVDELYYNVLVKDPPKPPRVVQGTKEFKGQMVLSQDKSQRTTHDLYLAAVNEMDIPAYHYEEFLEFLETKGWDQFYRRLGPVPKKSMHELRNFEERLFHQHLDMKAAMLYPAKRYPNPTQYTCPGCAQMSICKAMEEGDDPEFVKDSGYDIMPPRIEIPENILSPDWKGV